MANFSFVSVFIDVLASSRIKVFSACFSLKVRFLVGFGININWVFFLKLGFGDNNEKRVRFNKDP